MDKRLTKKKAKQRATKQIVNLLNERTRVEELPSTKKISFDELDFKKILKHSVYTDPVTKKKIKLIDVLNINEVEKIIQPISKPVKEKPLIEQDYKPLTIQDYVKIPIEIDDNINDNWYPPHKETSEYDKPIERTFDDIEEYTNIFMAHVDEIPDYRYVKIKQKGSRIILARDFTEIKQKLRSAWYDFVAQDNTEGVLKYSQEHWNEIEECFIGIIQDSDSEEIDANYNEILNLLEYDNSFSMSDKINLNEMSEING